MYAGIVLLVSNVLIYGAVLVPHGLEVSFLNVGNGDAVLVRSPFGATVLIGAGPDASILREIGTTLPFWKRNIDAFIATHDAADATAGLFDLRKRYQVGTILVPTQLRDEGKFPHALSAERGARLHLGGGAYIDVVHAESDVLALRAVYGNTSFFFSGDLSPSVRDWLIALDATSGELVTNVFFVPHHGASSVVDDAWLSALQPEFAVISVDAANRYGYPATSTLERLQKSGAQIFRTDRDGRIVFVSDGVTVSRK